MKTFRQYLNEDNFPQVRLAVGLEKGHDEININNKPVRDNINRLLASATTDFYLTPYLGLEKIRKILARYHIFIPKYTLFDNDHDVAVFEINQFGDVFDVSGKGDDPNYYIYFEFIMQTYGNYNIYCELVTGDELESLVNDAEDGAELNEDIFKNIKKKFIAQKMSDAGGEAIGDIAKTAKKYAPAIAKGLSGLGRLMGVGSKDDNDTPPKKTTPNDKSPAVAPKVTAAQRDSATKNLAAQLTAKKPAPAAVPPPGNPVKTDPAGRRYQVSDDGKTTKWLSGAGGAKRPEMTTSRNIKEEVKVLRPGQGPGGFQPKGGAFKLGDEDSRDDKATMVDKLNKLKNVPDKSPAVAPKVTDDQKAAATKSLAADLSKKPDDQPRKVPTSRVAPYQSDKPIPGVVKPGLDSTVKADNGKPVTDVKVKRSIDTAATPIKAGNTSSPVTKSQDRHPAMTARPTAPVADKKTAPIADTPKSGTEVSAPVPRPRPKPQLGAPKKPISNFGKAFAQARQKLGKKGVFKYQGKKYTTQYKEEVKESKDDLRAMVAAALKSKTPITKVAAGTTSNIKGSEWKRAMQTGGKVKVKKTFNVNPQSLAPSATFRGKATGFRKNLDEKRKVQLVYKNDSKLDKESFDAALVAAQNGSLHEELKKYNVHFKHMETKEPKIIEVHANNETQATNLGHAKLGDKQKFYRHKKTVANVMLSELSQKALKNYIGNASRHVNSVMAGTNKEPVEKTNKRIKNIYKAHDKTGSYSGFNEEENLNELSKRVLRSYKRKATPELHDLDRKASDAYNTGQFKKGFDINIKANKRSRGISKAIKNLNNRKGKIEEENLNELSAQTLDNYKDKVAKQVHLGRGSPKRAAGSRLASNKLDRSKPTKKKFPYSKLYAGVHKQTTNARVLAKEDNLNELSQNTIKSYMSKAYEPSEREKTRNAYGMKTNTGQRRIKGIRKAAKKLGVKSIQNTVFDYRLSKKNVKEGKSTAWDRLTKGYKKAYGTDLNQTSKDQAKAKDNLKQAGKDYEKITTRK